MPRQYKGLFWSGNEDYFIGEADGAQLEFRMAAELCADSTATDEIVNDVDVHSITADTLTAAGEPTTRQQAKASTFAPLFGGMGKSDAQRKYAEFFKRKYIGITDTQNGWRNNVVARKLLRTALGMIYFWPDVKVNRYGYNNRTTEINNYPIQGSATAEIIPIALIHFWHRTRAGGKITLLNTIHDSIVSKVHKDSVEEYKELSKQALTHDVYNYLRDVYDYQFTVPLGVGVKVSRNWGKTKEEHIWSVDPDGTETYKVKE